MSTIPPSPPHFGQWRNAFSRTKSSSFPLEKDASSEPKRNKLTRSISDKVDIRKPKKWISAPIESENSLGWSVHTPVSSAATTPRVASFSQSSSFSSKATLLTPKTPSFPPLPSPRQAWTAPKPGHEKTFQKQGGLYFIPDIYRRKFSEEEERFIPGADTDSEYSFHSRNPSIETRRSQLSTISTGDYDAHLWDKEQKSKGNRRSGFL